MKEIDAVISAHPEKELSLLKTKAEHFLYWRDYQQAEVILGDLIKRNKNDLWAIDELMSALYHQHKVQAIRGFLETDAGQQIRHTLNENRYGYRTEAIGQAITLAFLLSKDMIMPMPMSLKETSLRNVQKPGMAFREFSMNKVFINKSDFYGSNFSNAQIERSGFGETNFSDSFFINAKIEATRFSHVDFSKADLTNANFLRSSFLDVNFKNAKTADIDLTDSTYDCKTVWPDGFDPIAAGAKPMSECH